MTGRECERFIAKVAVGTDEDCWPWTAATLKRRGYGQFKVRGRMVRAHRLAFEWHWGPIPEGVVVHHLCGNGNCQNPLHMEAISTEAHDLLHRFDKKRTTCKRGHDYDYIDKRGFGLCQICHRLSKGAARLRRKQARLEER